MGSGVPQIDQKSCQNRNRCAESPKVALDSHRLNVPRPFLTILGILLGAKNRPKIDPWPKKAHQEASFYRFLSRMPFFSLLGMILGWFWVKIRWFFHCCFRWLLVFFATWRPSRCIVFYRSKRIFYFFVFGFLSQKWWKIESRMGCQKNTQKRPQVGTKSG